MNDKLKKKKYNDKRYKAQYMKTHKMLSLFLDKEKDADIIKWLESKNIGERSKAVRYAIRICKREEDRSDSGANNQSLMECPVCGKTFETIDVCPVCSAELRGKSDV